MFTCTKFPKITDSTASMCTLDNVVKELHVFSACERDYRWTLTFAYIVPTILE